MFVPNFTRNSAKIKSISMIHILVSKQSPFDTRKLHQYVNFTNILWGFFYAQRFQKRKKDSHVKQLFALLGSAWVKVASRQVDEIDPLCQKQRYQQCFYIQLYHLNPYLETWLIENKYNVYLPFHNSTELNCSWKLFWVNVVLNTNFPLEFFKCEMEISFCNLLKCGNTKEKFFSNR